MSSRPTGTVTFLFTDIEGSTRLLQRLGDRGYAAVLKECQDLLRGVFAESNGHEVATGGDGFLVVFSRASDAIRAAVAGQRALASHSWPRGAAPRVRMGAHTGEPLSGETGYAGIDVHRAARVAAAGHGGQILVSDATHGLVARDLPEGASLRDLGAHRLKDLAQPQRLFQVMVAELQADFPPLRSLDAHPHNLPVQLTTFIGRHHDIAEVKRLLGAARLVTLTGSGGAGKTRLALQVAAEVLEGYPDGVWLAEFASLGDPALVPKTVASALSVPEQPGREMIETLVEALKPKAVLLLLDNCEHLLAACADLAARVLRACPEVRILATSREGLRVPGETLWRVPSLSVPGIRDLSTPETVVLYEAVRLFVDRAVATARGFAITPENMAAVVQICHRLDGIPLAIELGAARVAVLSPEQIAMRLDDRFRLLTGGSRATLPRQQTLQAAMDWSYDLLSEPERAVLRRLSVFAGPLPLEAAEAVCRGAERDAAAVLDVLTSLVDKSLVLADAHEDEIRFRLLETIRQYGRDRLQESGEAATIRRRHRDWYLRWAEGAEPALRGPEQGLWLERLEGEHGNLRAALEWCVGSGEATEGLRLVIALWRFWATRFVREGRGWVEELLKRREDIPPRLRAKALMVAGNLAVNHRDYAAASTHLQESLTLQRDLRDEEGAALTLINLGLVAVRWGFDLPRARAFFEECLTLSRTSGNTRGTALALGNLGELAMHQGRHAEARTLLEESLEIQRVADDRRAIAELLYDLGELGCRYGDEAAGRRCFEECLAMRQELGDRRGIAWCFAALGEIAWRHRDYTAARRRLQESLSMLREWGDSLGIVVALNRLGAVARDEASYAEAGALLVESLGTAQKLRNPHRCAQALEELAQLSAAQADSPRAGRLFGAAEGLRETLGTPLAPCDEDDHTRAVAAARHADAGSFDTARAEGRSMTLEHAVEYALETDRS